MPNKEAIETWLRQWLTQEGAVAGTVHLRDGQDLLLNASVNIPPKVVEIVRSVPKGKGMAGLAFERNALSSRRCEVNGRRRPIGIPAGTPYQRVVGATQPIQFRRQRH